MFMKPKKFLFKFGPYDFVISAGSMLYREEVPGALALCAAKQFYSKGDILLDIPDFGIPCQETMDVALISALITSYVHKVPLYVGCHGGIGRTGLILGCLTQVMAGASKLGIQVPVALDLYRRGCDTDPVQYVREVYSPYAIETEQQEEFVRSYDPSRVVQFLESTLGVIPVAKEDDKEPSMLEKFARAIKVITGMASSVFDKLR